MSNFSRYKTLQRLGMLASAVVLCGLLLACSRRREMQWKEERWSYFSTVRCHFAGHHLWRRNAAIQQHEVVAGNCSWRRRRTAAEESREFQCNSRTPQLQREIISTLIQIYAAMDVFVGPCSSVVSDTDGLLASPEGWLRLRSHWLKSTSRLTHPVYTLLVEMEVSFEPRHPPSEKQDRHRLSWVRWSPPLDSWDERPSSEANQGDAQ